MLLQHWLWFVVHWCGYWVYRGSIKTTICKAYVPYTLACSGQRLLTGRVPEVKRALGLDLHYLLGCSNGRLNGHRTDSTCVTLLLLKSRIKAVIYRTLDEVSRTDLVSINLTNRLCGFTSDVVKWWGALAPSWHVDFDLSYSDVRF